MSNLQNGIAKRASLTIMGLTLLIRDCYITLEQYPRCSILPTYTYRNAETWGVENSDSEDYLTTMKTSMTVEMVYQSLLTTEAWFG